jgi:hypothetical protein
MLCNIAGFDLKSEGRGKLRPNVVRRVTWDTAKQRQQRYAHSIVRTRAIVSFFVSERDPLIQLVLNIARKEIASRAAGAKSPRIPG